LPSVLLPGCGIITQLCIALASALGARVLVMTGFDLFHVHSPSCLFARLVIGMRIFKLIVAIIAEKTTAHAAGPAEMTLAVRRCLVITIVIAVWFTRTPALTIALATH
jgi:hypothetical protein